MASFGGHRPPLQRREPREQFLVNAVKAAVAENRHDVVRLQERDDPLDNRRRVRLVKRRPAGCGDGRDDRLRMRGASSTGICSRAAICAMKTPSAS